MRKRIVTKQMLVAVLAAVVLLAGFAASALALTASGTTIGNSATATYMDSSNNTYTSTSNMVQTTVAAVCGASISPTSVVSKTGAPSQVVYVPFTLTNNGNSQNVFSLITNGTYSKTIYQDTNGNGVPDAGEPVITNATVAMGGTVNLVVAVQIPSGATSGNVDNFGLTATGTNPTGCSVTGLGQVNVTTDAVITGSKTVDKQTANPGNTLTYTINFQNTGLQTAKAGGTYNVDGTNTDGILVNDAMPAGAVFNGAASGQPTTNPTGYVVYSINNGTSWTKTAPGLLNSVTNVGFFMQDANPTNGTLEDVLPANQTGSLTFQAVVASGFSGTIPNNAVISYGNSLTPPTILTTTLSTSTSVSPIPVYGVTLSPNNTVPNVPSGSWVVFTHTVQNTGNTPDTLNISTAANNLPGGATIEYWNASGTAKLLDNNGDGLVDVGLVNAGASVNFMLKVYIPAGTANSSYNVTVAATSSNDKTKSATATDTISSLVTAAVDIAQSPNAADNNAGNDNIASSAVNPAAAINYSLEVANLGGSPDAFDLNATGLPVSSTATFYTDTACNGTPGSSVTSTGSLTSTSIRTNDGTCTNTDTSLCVYNATGFAIGNKIVVGTDGQMRTISNVDTGNNIIAISNALSAPATAGTKVSGAACYVMTVVTGAATTAGNYTLTVTAHSPASNDQDQMTIGLTINQSCSLALSPNGSVQIAAGGTGTITHTIKNNSNYSVTYTVAISPSSGTQLNYLLTDANGTYPAGTGFTNTLAPGASATYTFNVQVQAPSGIANGTVESVTVTANGGLCNASATDTATVSGAFLQLNKTALETQAAPGQPIHYMIQVSNTSNLTANKVVVTDAIPQYTNYVPGSLCEDTSCTKNATTCTSTFTDAAGDDRAEYDSSNTLVRFRLGTGADATNGGTMAPGAATCIKFQVQVQ